MEPHLKFELRRAGTNTVRLRVYFGSLLRPPWAGSQVAGLRDVWIEIKLARSAVAEAAAALERESRSFPGRSEWERA